MANPILILANQILILANQILIKKIKFWYWQIKIGLIDGKSNFDKKNQNWIKKIKNRMVYQILIKNSIFSLLLQLEQKAIVFLSVLYEIFHYFQLFPGRFFSSMAFFLQKKKIKKKNEFKRKFNKMERT